MSDLSLTAQLCDFILKHEPVRTPALRDAFPDCTNPAALLAGPVKSGYLVMCEIEGMGTNGRAARIAEYRVAEAAKGQHYEAFKRRGMPVPAAAVAPLKTTSPNDRVTSEGALEHPVGKPAKKGETPWRGFRVTNKPPAFAVAATNAVTAAVTADKAPKPKPTAAPAKATADATDDVVEIAVRSAPVFAVESTGAMALTINGVRQVLVPDEAKALTDFVLNVRDVIYSAHNTGASA